MMAPSSVWLLVLVAVFSIGAPVEASPNGAVLIKEAELRAEQTLNGLFHYYWKQDHAHKKIKFFFACAQLGGVGTSNYGRCSCYNPSSCVNCYRWWGAVALESVASYGICMNTSEHSTVPETFHNHSPYNAEWNATALCTYIDDFLWYGMAYLRVYDWLGVSFCTGPLPTAARCSSKMHGDGCFQVCHCHCACSLGGGAPAPHPN